MTSRLKHRLERENVNLRSAHLNESFVQIGTPLPALGDHKKDKQEYLPVWEQEVRDEQGRRRLHGAFTGGWSAGYFNTAGSKEGWQPTDFKSSRNNRATRTQRPEDFMDDEDLASLRADRQLENTDTFRSAGPSRLAGGPSVAAALESLVVPAQTSIGTALLQKLGWRPGQGIGPRVSLRKLRRQDAKLGRKVEDDEMGDEQGKHTFAPRDTRLVTFTGKEDKEGLGYIKGRGMGQLPGRRPVFGMDDDDDPYAVSDSRPTYVFDGTDDADDVVVMGEPARPTRNAPRGTDTWHDGRPVLPSFTLDPLGVPADKWFAFPDIPDDWRPRPARVWGTTRTFDDESAEKAQAAVRGAPGRPLTYDQRGEALGEEPKPMAAKSIFEFISEKDRERLAVFAAAAANKDTPRPHLSMDETPELPPERATEIVIPPLSPRTASAALKGYAPYGDDPAKQDRYQSYLESQTYNTRRPNPTLLPSLNVDDINKELEAFAASARIFKPMSFAMSSRFTSGSAALASSDMKQAKPGLHMFDAEKAAAAIEESKRQKADVVDPHAKPLGPREQAAASGMYGKLTREVKDFYPVKLVCKRFHVADPHPDAKGDAGEPAGMGAHDATPPLPANDASWTSSFVHQEGTERDPTPPPSETGDPGERAPRSLADVGMGDDGNQGRDTLTYTKPSIDIFKAIFASDDEDDDEGVPDGTAGTSDAKTAVKAEPADPYPVDDTPVDYATFKPVFKRADGDKERKRDKKDKKKRKGVLSFDVGEDGDEAAAPRETKRPKDCDAAGSDAKHRGRDGHAWPTANAADPAAGEWVEKVASAAGMVPAHPAVVADKVPGGVVEPRTGRKGAADFFG
ncbi:hypothetical protein Q5752_000627 [Cryptotrichosporon argae]